MSIVKELYLFVVFNPYLVSSIGGFLSEEFLVFLAILSGRGLLKLWIVFVFGFFGIFLSDSLWFYLGKSKIIGFIKKLINLEKKIEKLDERMDFIDKKRNFVYILATKFVYGTRIASIVYYSIKGMKYKKFLFYDFFAVLIWLVIMVPAAWFAGKGFHRALKFTRGIEILFTVILITWIVTYIINKIMKLIIEKELKR